MKSSRSCSDQSFILGIDKPCGLSSHDVVNRVRHVLGQRRVGHTGTLDPLASGVLCICVGAATRLDSYLSEHDKTYQMQICFGEERSTDDAEGEVVARASVPGLLYDSDFAQRYLEGLVGEGFQIPPQYSAIKVNGKRAYQQARAGNIVDLESRKIKVYESRLNSLEIVEGSLVWNVTMSVSKGTYMRSLARDIGRHLKTAAYVSGLRRTAVDRLGIEQCISLEELESDYRQGQIDPLKLLKMRFAFIADERISKKISNGAPLDPKGIALNRSLSGVFGDQCCTTNIFPSSDPLAANEALALLVANKLQAIYCYDQAKDLLVAKTVFSQGVERGFNL